MKRFLKSIFSSLYLWYMNTFHSKYRKALPFEDHFIISKDENEFIQQLIVVKDSEISEKLYSIFEKIIGENLHIPMQFENDIFITLKKFYNNKANQVKWFKFSISKSLVDNWDYIHSSDKKNFLCGLIIEMQKRNFYLAEEFINFSDELNAADLFSKFKPIEKEEDLNNGTVNLLKSLHCFYTNSNAFDENYYDEIIQSNPSYIDEFEIPFEPSVFCACLNYYLTASVPDITSWDYFSKKSHFEEYLVYIGHKPLKVISECDKYIIYEGNLKIYKDSEMFNEVYDNLIHIHQSGLSEEKVESIIYSPDMQRIGLKVYHDTSKFTISLKDGFKSLNVFHLLRYFHKIFSMIENAKKLNNFIHDENSIIEWDFVNKLILTPNVCRFETLDDCYDFCRTINYKDFCNYVCKTFGKMYSDLIKSKYSNISTEYELFEIPEIRYLNPKIAQIVCDIVLDKTISEKNYEQLMKFILTTNFESNSSKLGTYYIDPEFVFSPEEYPFKFDYELKEKFGIGINSETMQVSRLADNRKVIFFKEPTSIKVFYKTISNVKKKIADRLGQDFLKIETINSIAFSELIYSKKINSRGGYDLIGYISTPYGKENLSYELLLKLDNKKLFEYVGNYFAYFSRYTFPFEIVTIDDEGKFYVDTLDNNFSIISTGNRSTEEYLNCLFNTLISNGYNKNAFYNINPETWNPLFFSCKARDYTNFCKEHEIYHSGPICPICAETKFIMNSVFPIVYTTSTATHYSINEIYNAKIYDSEKIDMSLAEKCVDEAIYRKHNYMFNSKFDYGQDCFIPVKKVLDENLKFKGFMYKKVEFLKFNSQEYCINILNDYEHLSNLPRVKTLIRLITQVKELVNRNLSFIANPFEEVYLIKSHKKQVQLGGIEYLSENASKSDTIKWTYDYILKVLKADPYIELADIPFDLELENLLAELIKITDSLTKYCDIHHTYFDNKYVCCPHCISPEEQKNIPFEEVSLRSIISQTKINEGGESTIYQYGQSYVAKVFKDEAEANVDSDFKNKVMIKLLNKTMLLDQIDLEYDMFRFAIPRKLLVDPDSKEIFGYTMEKVAGRPLSDLRDKSVVAELGFTKKDILEILISVCKGIEVLHDLANIYIGDLNGRNILFDENKIVYFLDFDGMGIDGFKPEFCTDNYIDPISKQKGNITKLDDWYSIAVQAFYYLTNVHPFNGIYIDENGNSLNIIEKMEKRISLLGNHGIKVPSIAEPWDWMISELKQEFLEIFEQEKRESICSLLEKQYTNLYSGKFSKDYNHFVRINSKMIAANKIQHSMDLEGYTFERTIGPELAIYSNSSEEVVVIFDKDTCEKIQICTHEQAVSHLISLDGFYLANDKRLAICVKGISNPQISIVDIKDPFFNSIQYLPFTILSYDMVRINENKIYALTELYNQKVLKIINCNLHEITSENYKIRNDMELVDFDVQDGNKFIFAYRSNEESCIKIFANDIFLMNLSTNSYSAAIFFDEVKNNWAIIDNNDYVVIINKSTGEIKNTTIPRVINNIATPSFINGKFYIPFSSPSQENFVDILDVEEKQTKTFKIETNKRVFEKPNFKVHTVTNKGFCLTTDQGVFEVRMG